MTNNGASSLFSASAISLILAIALGAASLPTIAEPTRLGLSSNSKVAIDNAKEIWDEEGAPWPRWRAHNETNKFTVNYNGWERFMTEHSDQIKNRGALDYVHVFNRGMGFLAGYIYALEKVPVSKLSHNEQLAYWLNLHNAQAVETTAFSLKAVADEAETTRQLILGKKWREKSLEVEGEKISLVDIERRIVMRQWGEDQRVLYGIHLPALGAPGLPIKPFTGATVWKALDDRARAFVNSEHAMEFHNGQLHVSALYYWDRWFFKDDAAVLDHLRIFAKPSLKARLAKVHEVTATYLNWRINSFNSGYDRHQDRQGGS